MSTATLTIVLTFLGLVLIGSDFAFAGNFGKEMTEDVPANVLIFSEEFGDIGKKCEKTTKGQTRKRPPCETRPFCNGFVIDTHWVITAAHCIGYVKSFLVCTYL